MANMNNCFFNAAMSGFFQGAMSGSWIRSAVPTDYLALKNAAVAFATQVDSGIPFDATVTTSNVDPSMLVSTASNTIQSNTMFKPGILEGICEAAMNGRYSQDATPSDYAAIASAVVAAYTEAILGLVSP